MSWSRVIAHADMDAFYASVEQHDDPSLIGRPLLIGSRSGRGVVLTASYEARPFRVGSAMPMAEALRRCPDAVVIPPRFERYTEASAQIMAVFEDFSPTVEPLSLDEAFIDMSGAAHIFGTPRDIGTRIKAAVREATGLTISVGMAATKYVAKVASGFDKPDGLTVVEEDNARAWLAPLPVARLWGAGPKTQARLNALGYETIADVAAADPERLRAELGHAGAHFYELAHARDPRPVERSRRGRSMGSERTLLEDITDPDEILAHLRRSADRIARRLRDKRYVASGVRVRLKTSRFESLTRQCTLRSPTDAADDLLRAASTLLPRFDHPGPFRLVGLAAFELTRASQPRQLDLLDADPRPRKLEGVLDAVNEKFGAGAVRRARDVGTVIGDTSPNLDGLVADTDDPSADDER